MKKKLLTVTLCAVALVLTCVLLNGGVFAAGGQSDLILTAKLPARQTSVLPVTKDNRTNDELFAGYVERLFLSGAETNSAYDNPRLSGMDAAVYSVLRPYIAEAATGSRSSTVFEIALDDLGLDKTSWTAEELGVTAIVEGNSITEEAINAVSAKLSFDLDRVVIALLADCPYELYWYDKTATAATSYTGPSFSAHYDGEWVISLTGSFTFSFKVAEAYSAGDYLVDTAKATAAQTAAANAKAIVKQYEDSSDDQKLTAYKDAICGLVSYDHAAAGGGVAYGDPWQVISIFDGDEATNVVCEGYSKAFKYLCDMSEFSGEIACITVTGTMSGGTGAGPHMWNIVSIGGANYLVDVTNCDDETVGAPDLLFLKGYQQGSVSNGYVFVCGSVGITYQYDSSTKKLCSESELTLSDTDYEPASNACGDHATWDFNAETGVLTISGTGDMYDWMYAVWEDTGLPVLDLTAPWYAAGKDAITSVVIEPGITSIGSAAFAHCENLASITIPDTVTGIGTTAFMYSGLNSLTIPDSVTGALGFNLCCGCEELETVSIGAKVTEIGNWAFASCHKLSAVTIGKSVTNIGEYAFSDCFALESVTLPVGVQAIGTHAFGQCSALTGIRIPDGVTVIEDETFGGCKALAEVTLSKNLTSIGNYAFAWCAMEEIEVPDGVTTIGDTAFYSTKLKQITLPDGLEQIGECVFGWSALESISIPAKITAIPRQTFCWCEKLEEVSLPRNVTSIGEEAFTSCTNLTLIHYDGTAEAWDAIAAADKNESLYAAEIHFNDKTIRHVPGEAVRENEIAATCAASGSYDEVVYCAVCHTELSRTPITSEPSLSHSAFLHHPAVPATCSEPGSREHWECGVCGKLFVVPALPYQPEEQMTRAGMAQLVVNALGLTWQGTANPFTDVDPSMPEYTAILTAYENGIVNGTGADTFQPYNTISRAQAATMLARIYGAPQPDGSGFVPADVPATHWAYPYVLFTIQYGLMWCDESGSFDPNRAAAYQDINYAQLCIQNDTLVEVSAADLVIPRLHPLDANADGTVDEIDAADLLLGVFFEEDGIEEKTHLDVNKDGTVDLNDAVDLLFEEVSPAGLERFIVAAYDAGGRMTGLVMIEQGQALTSAELDLLSTAAEVKFFLTDDAMAPVAESIVRDLTGK